MSSITYADGATTFAGPTAVQVYQASALVVALRNYARQHALHGRAQVVIGATPGRCMRLATMLTGKTFRRNDYAAAAQAVAAYRDTLLGHVTVIDQRT